MKNWQSLDALVLLRVFPSPHMSAFPDSDPVTAATKHAVIEQDAPPGEDISVTVLVSRRIREGCEAEFQERLCDLHGLLDQQKGFCELKAYKPGTQDDEHKVMLRFASAQELEEWQQSPQRQEWMESVKPLEATPPRAHILTGLETWFTLPEQEGLKPPPAHKMGLVTWLGIFPLVAISNWVILPHLHTLPLVAQAAISTAITVSMMTYVVMPRLTRLCARFLYPEIDLPASKHVD